jgi:TatD DNase family protein
MKLIDTHCHLDDPVFDNDRDHVLSSAQELGVNAIIVPGIKQAWWPRVKRVCDSSENCFSAFGFHPMFMQDHLPQHVDMLEEWLSREKPVALGECGLDFYIDNPERETQTTLFEKQIVMSVAHDLPLIIHARKSVEQVIGMVKRHPDCRGVLHSYSGSLEQARILSDRGFYLSFGGPMTYPGSTRLRKLVAELPLESLLLETDAPDQPDAGIRGQRNFPGRIKSIFDEFCKLRAEPVDEIEDRLLSNATRLFRLSLDSIN